MDEPSKKNRWNLVKAWKNKRQGIVWVVENDKGQKGYFKYTTSKHWFYSGTMIANEFIAAALARRLGFPMAQLEYTSVVGPNGKKQKGIVSVVEDAKEVITWYEAPASVWKEPEKYVEQVDLLSQMVVFDAWITNIDRAPGKNLILYRNESWENYKWYLIDHGHTLYGSPRKWKRGQWNSSLWQKLWRFYNVPRGLLRLQSSIANIEPMIKKIETMSNREIAMAIKEAPSETIKKQEKEFIKQLLITRKKQIRNIMHKWLDYKGTREYEGAP